jgi:peroxiredoxin-like protein
MQQFPHKYTASASAETSGDVRITSDGLEPILSAPPEQFDGPGDRWSPEDLLVAAVADCFVLTFRAIARHSKLEWMALKCEVEGTLDKDEGGSRFTEFSVKAALKVPSGVTEEKAQKLLQKSEQHCLITNSLSAKVALATNITVG